MAIPDKFLWGGSISAAQCEGGWDEGGKSPVQVDFGDPGSTTDRRWIHYLNADGTRGKMRQFDHLPKGAKYQLFDDMTYTIDRETTIYLLRAEIRQNIERKQVAKGEAVEDKTKEKKQTPKKSKKVGRNDPCPCGSGKKYKNCCLRG